MFHSFQSLGIDIGLSGLKLVLGFHKPEGFQILRYANLPFRSTRSHSYTHSTEDAAALSAVVNQWKIKRKRAVFSVHGPDLYSYSFVLPKLPPRMLRKAAILRATTTLPLPLDQLVYDVALASDAHALNSMRAVFIAARKGPVVNGAKLIKTAGLKPVVADLALFALKRTLVGLPSESMLGYVDSDRIAGGVFSGNQLEQSFFLPEPEAAWILTGVEAKLYAEAGQALQALYQARPLLERKLYLAASDEELKSWQKAMQVWNIEVCPIVMRPDIMDRSEAGKIGASYYIALGLALRGGR